MAGESGDAVSVNWNEYLWWFTPPGKKHYFLSILGKLSEEDLRKSNLKKMPGFNVTWYYIKTPADNDYYSEKLEHEEVAIPKYFPTYYVYDDKTLAFIRNCFIN